MKQRVSIDIRVVQEKLGCDGVFAKKMLSMFIDSLSESRLNMEEAYKQRDWEKLCFHVHKERLQNNFPN